MTITPVTWKVLADAIASIPHCPPWLKEQASLSWEVVARLPVLDATSDGQHAAPTVEQKLVRPDYLDFLREQIELNPRGPEWLDLLKNRLTALEPFAGRELIVATFHFKPYSVTIRISLDVKKVIHMEVN